MVKQNAPPGTVSVVTGKTWQCHYNDTHHPQPVVLPIKRGPKRFFLPPCICGCGNHTMPPDWTADMGMTVEQARARGFLVLAVFPRASASR